MNHVIEELVPGLNNLSGTYGTRGVTTALHGLALQLKSQTGTPSENATREFELADGTREDAGCLTRDVSANGPSVEDHFWPGRIEQAIRAGDVMTVEKPQRLVVEGGEFIKLASTGAISSATAVKTVLSYEAGKLMVAQPGQVGLFELLEVITPETADELRIRVQRISAGIIPTP